MYVFRHSAAMILLWSWLPLSAAQPSRSVQPRVVILTTSAVAAFGEAAEGIRSRLVSETKVVTIDLAEPPSDLTSQVGGKDVRLLIAVGNNALAAAQRYGTAPVIATMVMRADLPTLRPPWSAVVLDLTLTEVLSGLARAFPGKTRAGMIRNPEVDSAPEALLASQAKAAGMTLKVVDCPRPERLLQSFLSLRDLVDFVWCPPDGTLYNGTTVKPLIRASLDSRLPVAGFSESFVQSGAAAGVYPDYRQVGVQVAELARSYLAGSSPAAVEGPRKTRVAANTRVARLLGIRMSPKGPDESSIVVIE
jgi:ABC-type uncharacterized transport system substrate-binding protein